MSKNIYQKLLAITEEAEKIPKNGRNKFSNYNYVRAIDVLGSLRPLLIKYGVHVSFKEKSHTREAHAKDNGGKNFHSVIKGVATFINTDDPKDIHEVPYFSVAADSLDKDIFKAKTGGVKYVFANEFKIITNDFIDPEDDNKEFNKKPKKEKSPPNKEKEISQFLDLCNAKEMTETQTSNFELYLISRSGKKHFQEIIDTVLKHFDKYHADFIADSIG